MRNLVLSMVALSALTIACGFIPLEGPPTRKTYMVANEVTSTIEAFCTECAEPIPGVTQELNEDTEYVWADVYCGNCFDSEREAIEELSFELWRSKVERDRELSYHRFVCIEELEPCFCATWGLGPYQWYYHMCLGHGHFDRLD